MISVNVGQVNEKKNYTGPEFTDGPWRITAVHHKAPYKQFVDF